MFCANLVFQPVHTHNLHNIGGPISFITPSTGAHNIDARGHYADLCSKPDDRMLHMDYNGDLGRRLKARILYDFHDVCIVLNAFTWNHCYFH
jgi:hypothetical protein